MPSWPSPEPATCAKLTAHVAQILDESGVGSIAWGHQPFSLFQYDRLGKMKVQELIFVINDRQIQDAINALENVAGFPVCTKPKCIELEEQRMLYMDKVRQEHGARRLNPAFGLNAPDRQHCVGVAHFHRGPDSDPDAVFNQDCEEIFGLLGPGSHVVITLMRQGEMMPWLSELKPGPPAANDPHLTTSHDSRFPARADDGPSGPWIDYYAVQMLNRESFVESLIWLLCRDLHRFAYTMWFPMIFSLKRRDKEGSIKLQSEEFGHVWDDLLTGKLLHGTAQLRERLIAERRLPKDLPHIPTDDQFDPFPGVTKAAERNPVLGVAFDALLHLLTKGASP
ncbi:uncharacterized protein APUU_21166A [Aspergillus puulaauensis]|uniref:Uncharacterized protein n=1 Tax=Aspergillus puulaauensis TaxID=1220207 RepID=A0A7R7XGA0_9EURO|nr:uncharacterized protein APUU_21166A [Aspergillus puulaauensis]BCS20734.1 hypothetical protein APUU_21166A [Aspergillus puulaauensis]